MLGIIKAIEEINKVKLGNSGPIEGRNGSRLGVTQMIKALCGYGEYDGYKITTDEHEFAVYNEHNGYYGHGIIFAKDTEIVLQDTL